jgi:tRNA dimethylallyltransferase
MQERDYPAIAVVGPTGSGKSSLALDLAREFHGEIVSCDALQVYRFMDIGTAKPSPIERGQAPHHMLDARDPDEDFSAGDYQRLGREAICSIRSREATPFVVGGTGFYFRALIQGLFEGPARSDAARARMRRILERKGPRPLHRALRRVDPEAAAAISETDASRIVRAYEVYLTSGKPISWWRRQRTDRLEGFSWLKLGLYWPRQLLYQRIDRRVIDMHASGFVEEVRSLLQRYPKSCHAFKAIGYRQIVQFLEGRCDLEQAIRDTQMESRRYAKRQLTWFRSDPEIVWLDANSDWQELQTQAHKLVTAHLRGGGLI